ncbi:MAG: hypothetical protein A2504_17700 [Bdellovibrionales bacterium RIFOXYD12_FULL_39_22]|nr:MAG: hypothetical protein A2385_15400 [Bdellovibrionales bacterium RIFOXYB1_FULL_39_21]OFZ40606.1 MAG: hypothetical protein A2485_03365 [Bdellovibrionales bacterium RIFOXYC12_FULL_39_17]OFZ50446.1 MAG: hypothetical protein A2404_02700 [Bdellovibrionales bacterium RIFOXYC1_FULL_39_130]OFZ68115.1 MAG: hypothetical protein A2451_00015 [Bdellovibrionales bacterium RIFOXYC2_FULL_39_8]OFZ77705.1 MAG: hypothetical protein A2560_05070 [Bdellovibrionales bacterium RIFOXYD1_FULL_39_84]OFZ91739.1 MAG:
MKTKKGRGWFSKGQTSVEYAMMISVAAILIISISGKLYQYLKVDPAKCQSNPELAMCKITGLFMFAASEDRLIYYNIPR